jgi:hypothetical protein
MYIKNEVWTIVMTKCDIFEPIPRAMVTRSLTGNSAIVVRLYLFYNQS